MEAASGGAAPDGTRRSRLRGLLRGSGADGDAAPSEQLEELEREVALLREENARLKVAREHAGDRPVNERVRTVLASWREGDELAGEDAWEVLTEGMLLRDALVDACRELEQGARELRTRLETLLPGAEGEGLGVRSSDELERVS